MELLYLWIYNHKNIYKTGFNFSPEFEFEYNDDKRELTITKLKNKDLDLFDNSFLNITAIIGKNGSGKSNLIEFLRKIFTMGILFGISDYLLILKTENGELIVFDEKEKNELVVHTIYRDIKYTIEIGMTKVSQEVSLIYYTNSFSIYETTFLFNEHRDLSLFKTLNEKSKAVNKHIIDNVEDYLRINESQEINENARAYLTDQVNPISWLYLEELRRKIEFIVEYKGQIETLSFIPASLKINHNVYNQLEALNEQTDLSKKIVRILENYIYIQNLNVKFENLIIIVLFVDIVNSNILPLLTDINKLYDRLNQTIDEIELPQAIKNEIIALKEEEKFYPINKVKSFLKELPNKLKDLKLDTNLGSNQEFTFELDKNLKDFLFELFGLSPTIVSSLYFDWTGMSAGESALLSLFARINSIKKKINTKYIWLAIDEGELYLHPEWQRNFLNDLHTYLPKMFLDKKIQLFLTSHSPFLVSDLPVENIILLNKEEETGQCKVEDQSSLGQTFGANIHSLFKESFFLENGTMGEFAKSKIDGLIKFLSNDPEEQENLNRETSLNQIQIIGEPIIRNYLLDLWEKKFSSDFEFMSRDELIRELRKYKLEKLNNASN